MNGLKVGENGGERKGGGGGGWGVRFVMACCGGVTCDCIAANADLQEERKGL